MANRPPVVAYCNSRLILMHQHEDCSEFRARATYDGRDFDHTAIAYQEGEAFFTLTTTQLTGTDEKREVECIAFMNARDAARHALTRVAHARGWKRGE